MQLMFMYLFIQLNVYAFMYAVNVCAFIYAVNVCAFIYAFKIRGVNWCCGKRVWDSHNLRE